MTSGSFLYCACQAGAEAALKLAVGEEHPRLRPAFGRPGLVTFKAPSPLPAAALRVASPLARVWGISIGPARGVEELCAALEGPAAAAAFGVLAAGPREPVRLHVWERDRWQPGHEPLGFAYGPAAAAVRAEIEAAWPGSDGGAEASGTSEERSPSHEDSLETQRHSLQVQRSPAPSHEDSLETQRHSLQVQRSPSAPHDGSITSGHPRAPSRPRAQGEAAEVGALVLDVILGEEGEPWLAGLRRRRADEVPFPGGRIPVPRNEHAPSRAYYKLEEALRWSRAPICAGDVAVELGSAPGGASWALLQRGLEVHGIDNAEMDPRVLEHRGPGNNRFVHHRCLMGQVQRSDLPRTLHWVLCDVNLAPQVAFQTIRRMVARPRQALQGVLLTLKLDTWKALRHLPRWRTQIEAMGMVEIGVTQLPSNRLELFAYGLTPAGAARRAAGPAASTERAPARGRR